MIKKVFPIIFSFMLLIISGCNEEVAVDGPFEGGTGGVSLSFVEGAPISEFSEDQQVPIKVKLKNNGEYDIPENSIQVALYGLAMEDYSLTSSYISVPSGLMGIRKGLIEEGAEISVDMGILNYVRDLSTSYIERNLRSKVCYPYKTVASVSACASSREIEESGGEKVCNIGQDRIKFVSGNDYTGSQLVSSSPIQVTKFIEELEGTDKVKFKIDIENKGVGQTYMEDSDCSMVDTSPVIRAEKEDKVHFKVLPEDVTCISYDGSQGNEGYVKLDLGKRTLVCTMPVENNGANYEREVTIYLDFKYMQSISKQLTILQA